MRKFDTPARSSSAKRSKKKISISSAQLSEIKNYFDSCVSEIKKKFSIYDVLISGTATDEEIAASEDILRFQLVSIDSVFEIYMHKIFTYGIKKMFNEEWEKTGQYNKITVKLPVVENALLNPEDTTWIENIIEEFKAKDTFMSSSSVVFALNAIGVEFNDIAVALSYVSANDLRIKIDNIYKRRTDIVHYADMDISTQTKNSIDKSLVENAINTIETFCNEVYKTIDNKDKIS